MNAPPGDDGGGAAHGIFGSSGFSGFGYGVGVSVGILLVASTIALAFFGRFLTRRKFSKQRRIWKVILCNLRTPLQF